MPGLLRPRAAKPIRHVVPVYDIFPWSFGTTSRLTIDLDPSAPNNTWVKRLVPSSNNIFVKPSLRLSLVVTATVFFPKWIGIPSSLAASNSTFCNFQRRIPILSISSSPLHRIDSFATATSVPSCLCGHRCAGVQIQKRKIEENIRV